MAVYISVQKSIGLDTHKGGRVEEDFQAPEVISLDANLCHDTGLG
jgi:hypothetical protein